jgi:sugar porter (SP) family MFS transporter
MGNGIIYAVSGFAAIGGFLFGYDIGVISGVIAIGQFSEYMTGSAALDSVTKATVVSILLAGCFVGALISGILADVFGRRWSIFGSSTFFILGAVLQAAATKLEMMYCGRVVSGLAIGSLSMMVPLYQSEIAPKEIRGRLISLQQWAITIGILISFWIDYGTSFMEGTASWRIPLGIQAAPAFILAIGMLFMPYSPRWLLDKDRDDDAWVVLARLHGNGDKSHPLVQEEFNEIKESIRIEREETVRSYAELFKGTVLRRLILGVFIQIFQQLTGINSIMYYAPAIFQQAGLQSTSASLLATGINGVLNMLATIPAILYIDRWGRRWTLISGAAIMGGSMLIIGVIMASVGKTIYNDNGTKTVDLTGQLGASYTIIVFIYIFVMAFAYSWGPIGWIYPSEIYPLRIRAKATSITTAANWLFNFVIGYITPLLMDSITWGVYILLMCFCVVMSISVYFFYPETKGKSLEEMEVIFGSTSSFVNGDEKA